MKLVLITGTDGCGKTTTAESLVRELRSEGIACTYFYGRHFAILLLPLRLIARVTALRGKDQYSDYKKYMQQKAAVGTRFRLLSRLYGCVWLLDYVVATTIRLLPHIWQRKVVIVDRYLTDTAINISISLGRASVSDVLRLLAMAERLMPTPSVQILLDVDPKTAFRRKDDVPALQYLEERRGLYVDIWDRRGWPTVDGALPPAVVCARVTAIVKKVLFHASGTVAAPSAPKVKGGPCHD